MRSILAKILNRPPGSGWLVISGGSLPDAQMLRVLELTDRAGTIIALAPRSEALAQTEEWLSTWLDLSGRPGNPVDCETGTRLEEEIAEASLILIPDLFPPQVVAQGIGQSDAVEYLLGAIDEGALILAEGAAAEALGEVVEGRDASGETDLTSGLNWIPSTLIQAHFTPSRSPDLLLKRPQLVRVGLPDGTAMALGPEGDREIWGETPPILTFGSRWTNESPS
jgi:hypothetical protein